MMRLLPVVLGLAALSGCPKPAPIDTYDHDVDDGFEGVVDWDPTGGRYAEPSARGCAASRVLDLSDDAYVARLWSAVASMPGWINGLPWDVRADDTDLADAVGEHPRRVVRGDRVLSEDGAAGHQFTGRLSITTEGEPTSRDPRSAPACSVWANDWTAVDPQGGAYHLSGTLAWTNWTNREAGPRSFSFHGDLGVHDAPASRLAAVAPDGAHLELTETLVGDSVTTAGTIAPRCGGGVVRFEARHTVPEGCNPLDGSAGQVTLRQGTQSVTLDFTDRPCDGCAQISSSSDRTSRQVCF